MQLVKFLIEYNGHTSGSYQWYDEVMAGNLIKGSTAVDATKEYEKAVNPMKEPDEERVEKKAVEAPKKDKMVRSPRKKKAAAKPADDGMHWRK
jgi:hypothetical protein